MGFLRNWIQSILKIMDVANCFINVSIYFILMCVTHVTILFTLIGSSCKAPLYVGYILTFMYK